MKITYSTDTIHSFGGVNFTDQLLSNAGVYENVDTVLGPRPLTSHYTSIAICCEPICK